MARYLTSETTEVHEDFAKALLIEPQKVDLGDMFEGTGVKILEFVAAKVTLSALAGFVGRDFYEKWKQPVSKQDLDTLRRVLVGSKMDTAHSVPYPELLADASGKLEAEGLDPKTAREVADRVLRGIHAQLGVH